MRHQLIAAVLAATVPTATLSAACGTEPGIAAPDCETAAPSALQDMPIPGELPILLSETGYIAAAVTPHSFTPRFALWTDGAEKERFAVIPQGAVIDDSDVDNWQLPVGTRLFKTFSMRGKKLETRVMWRAEDRWLFGAYLWNDAQTDAVLVDPNGAENVDDMGHDVPSRDGCSMCHVGSDGVMRALGFSAMQLGHGGNGITASKLRDAGTLMHSPRTALPPGDSLDREVLGWLHVNCGTCHTDGGYASYLNMRLRLTAATLGDVKTTGAYTTTVNKGQESGVEGFTSLVVPGLPAESLLYARLTDRADIQMPPLGTEHVDTAGAALIAAWITRLAQ